MILVGVTGTIGAGKGVVVDYLKHHGFVHYSAREFILEEVRRRGLPETRENTTTVANDLRATKSPSYIIENLHARAAEKGENAVIESVRALGELDFLRKQKDFYLIAVDADPKMRYGWVVLRKSSLDHVSYEKFLADEQREFSSKNPAEGSLKDCIAEADFLLMNTGTREELGKKVGEVLKKIRPN